MASSPSAPPRPVHIMEIASPPASVSSSLSPVILVHAVSGIGSFSFLDLGSALAARTNRKIYAIDSPLACLRPVTGTLNPALSRQIDTVEACSTLFVYCLYLFFMPDSCYHVHSLLFSFSLVGISSSISWQTSLSLFPNLRLCLFKFPVLLFLHSVS